jgi:outer membrane murein-binding lipoprotein Lpp
MKRIDFVVMVAAVLVVLLIAGCVSAPQKETSTSAETYMLNRVSITQAFASKSANLGMQRLLE